MLTLSANFKRHFLYNSAPDMRLLVRVYTSVGASSAFTDGPCDLFSYPVSVSSVTPVSRSMDPIKRTSECSSCDVELEMNDGTSALLVSAPLYMSFVSIKLGTKEMAEVDFAPYFSGFIDEVVPSTTTLLLRLKTPDINNRKIASSSAIIGKHPLDAILELLAVDDSLVDLGSFDYTQYTSISHFVVTRGDIAEWNESREIAMSESRQDMIDELVGMCYGMLRTNEDGTLEYVHFDTSTGSVATWLNANIGDVEVQSLYENLFTEVNILSHIEDKSRSSRNVKNRVRYKAKDSTAAAVFRNFAATSADADRSLTLNNDWVSGSGHHADPVPGKIWTAVVPAAGDYVDIYVGEIFCGTRWPAFPSGSQDANAAISASRPLYVQVQGEIISFDAIDFDPGLIAPWVKTATYYSTDEASGYESSTTRPGYIRGRVLARGALGTTAAAHPEYQTSPKRGLKYPMYDITIPVWTASKLITRFGFGAPVVTLTTSLAEMAVQVGDFVVILSDRIRWYSNSRSGNDHKWEVIGKEVILSDDSPRISWTVCLASDSGRSASTLSRTIFGAAFVSAADRVRMTRAQLSTVQKFVHEGFGYTINGLVVTIATGIVVTSAGAREMTAAVDISVVALASTVVTVDAERGSVSAKHVSPEDDTPDLLESEVPLWRFTADATSIVKTEDLRPRASTVGRQIDIGTLGTAAFDTNYVGPEVVQNPNFSVFSRDQEVYPPDSWTLHHLAEDTDPESCLEPTHIETVTGTTTLASLTTALTLAAAPTVDDALYLGFVSDSITVSSISQTNVTWTQVGTNLSHGGTSQVSSAWQGNPTGTGGTTVTVTFSANGVGDPIILTVWRNVPAVTPDASATATGTSATVDTGNIASTQGRVLMLGFASRETTAGDAFADYGEGWVEAATVDGVSSPSSTAHALSMFTRIENGGTFDFKATLDASDKWNAHALIIPAFSLVDGTTAQQWTSVLPLDEDDGVWSSSGDPGTAYTSSDYSTTGEHSLHIVLDCRAGTSHSLGFMSDLFPVQASGLYQTAWAFSVLLDSTRPSQPATIAAATIRAYVVWYDVNGVRISEYLVAGWSGGLTADVPVISGTLVLCARAPANAVMARVVVSPDDVVVAESAVIDFWWDHFIVTKVGAAVQAIRATSTQSVNSATTTKVQFNDELFDFGADFDAVTNYRFDVRDTGRYSISAIVTMGAIPAGKYVRADIYIDNAVNHYGQASWNGSASDQDMTAAVWIANVRLVAGSYVDIRITHDSGSAKNVQIGQEKTRFAIEQVALDTE